MGTRKHYEKMLAGNPDASIGFTLAAQAVYAAKNGIFDANSPDHNDAEYRKIARDLKTRHGENLGADDVRAEMIAIAEPMTEMIVRKVPESLRRAFKVRCAEEGISQQDKMIELMREYLK